MVGNLRRVVPLVILLQASLLNVGSATEVELLPPGDAPARYTVGFFRLPRDLMVGDDYNGGTVVRIDRALSFAAVETRSPLSFEVRTSLDDDVRYVEPTPWMPLLALVPNDPLYSDPGHYGPKIIGAEAAWDITVGTTTTVVCVGDTGVRYTHEDLAGRYGGGFDFVNNDNDPVDDHGHGTHVTGTAAATINNAKGIAGMAQATYKHAKVLNSAGSGTWDGVASGIRWCADNGGHVISLSLGGSAGATVLEDAVNYA